MEAVTPLEWIADKMPLAVAGGLGGLSRSLSAKRWSLREFFANITVGGIASVYFGPVGTAVLTPVISFAVDDPIKREALGGFLVGIGGITIVQFIVTVWRIRSVIVAKQADKTEPPK